MSEDKVIQNKPLEATPNPSRNLAATNTLWKSPKYSKTIDDLPYGSYPSLKDNASSMYKTGTSLLLTGTMS